MYMGGMLANREYTFNNHTNILNPGDWDWSSGSTYYGIVSGGLMGASMAGVQLPSLFPTQPSILLEGINEAGRQVFINGVVNTIDGDPFFDDWYWAAGKGFVTGGFKGYRLADEIGLKGTEVFYCSLDKRAQTWANYFGMKGFNASAISYQDTKKYLNGFNGKYIVTKVGSKTTAEDKFTGDVFEIEGLYDKSLNRAYFKNQVIRRMRTDGGWAKGTMYHEYTHFAKGSSEPVAYRQGLIYGGRGYYRHCNYYFPSSYSSYQKIINFMLNY